MGGRKERRKRKGKSSSAGPVLVLSRNPNANPGAEIVPYINNVLSRAAR